MDPFELRRISDTDIAVTCLGFGGASMGNMYTVAHDDEALEAIRSAYEGKVRYFDTAPMYGFGKSERLYGSVLKDQPRDSFVSFPFCQVCINGFHVPGDLSVEFIFEFPTA